MAAILFNSQKITFSPASFPSHLIRVNAVFLPNSVSSSNSHPPCSSAGLSCSFCALFIFFPPWPLYCLTVPFHLMMLSFYSVFFSHSPVSHSLFSSNYHTHFHTLPFNLLFLKLFSKLSSCSPGFWIEDKYNTVKTSNTEQPLAVFNTFHPFFTLPATYVGF